MAETGHWFGVRLASRPNQLTQSCLGHITQMFPASVPSLEKWENNYFPHMAILMLMVIYLKGLGYIYITAMILSLKLIWYFK